MRRVLITFFCLLFFVGHFLGCSDKPLAGGGVETNNTIVGTILDENGEERSGIVVTLYSDNYNPLTPDDPEQIREGNDNRYTRSLPFQKVNAATYNISAIRSEGSTAALIQGVEIESESLQMTVTETQLKKTGKIEIDVSEYSVKEGDYFYIPGTDIYKEINTENIVLPIITLNQVPSAIFTKLLFKDEIKVQGTNIISEPIEVLPQSTQVIYRFSQWSKALRININTTASGADVSGEVHQFPLLVRLHSPEFFESSLPGGADLRFTKSDSTTPLPFEIESWDSSQNEALVWVTLDTIYGNNNVQYILMYTGNDSERNIPLNSNVFDTASGFVGAYHMSDVNGLTGCYQPL